MRSLVIGNGLKAISNHTFYDCENLTNLVIGGNMETIGSYAFMSCSALKTVNIPNSVKTIQPCAFAQCYGLTEVNIGSGVTEIGYGAFGGDWQLSAITCHAVTPPVFTVNESWATFNYNVYEQATLYVPEEAIPDYKNAYIWKDFTNVQAIIDHIPGDTNGDGTVNISDINVLIEMILSGKSQANGDVNGDGSVNIADVNAVIDIILKQ